MSPSSLPPTDSRPLIMVVEDEPLVGNMLSMVLQRNGCAVLLASSGEEAVERFRSRDGDVSLVFLDVRMTGMDGPHTLQALQQIDPTLPCCFITGDAGKYSDDDLLQCGALRVIKKPFRLSEIEAFLKEWTP